MSILQKVSPFVGGALGGLAAAVLFGSIGYFVHHQAVSTYEDEEYSIILDRVLSARSELESALALSFSLSKGIEAPYAIKGDLDDDEFSALAAELMAEVPYVRNIGLAKGTIFSNVYPFKGNEKVIGIDYRKIPAQWPKVQDAIEHKRPVIDGPLTLIQGGQGLIQRTPVFRRVDGRKHEYLGLVSLVINVDRLVGLVQDQDLQLAIKSVKDDEAFYGKDSLFRSKQRLVRAEIALPDGKWELVAIPSHGWGSLTEDKLANTRLILVITVVLLVLLCAYSAYYQVSREHLYRALGDSERNYIERLKNAPDAMLFFDQRGVIVDANTKACSLFEVPITQLIGQYLEDLVPPKVYEKHFLVQAESAEQTSFQAAAEKNQPVIIFTRNHRKIYVEVNLGAYGEGADLLTIATIRDVSLRVRLEQEVTMAEEILHDALETVPDGFVVFDQDDRLVTCNSAFKKIYKTSAPAIRPGASFEDILRYGVERGQYPEAGGSLEEQDAWIAKRVAQHRETPETEETQEAIIQRTDKGRWLKIEERKTEKGYTVGIRSDVTDLKRAEEEIMRQRDLLALRTEELSEIANQYRGEKEKVERAMEARNNFLKVVSDELLDPLSEVSEVIRGLFLDDMSDERKGHIRSLVDRIALLSSILSDIRDYAAMEAGKVSSELATFHLDQVMNEALLSRSEMAQSNGVMLSVSLEPENLSTRLYGPVHKLRLMLSHLIAHVVLLSEGGEVCLSVIGDPHSNRLRFRMEAPTATKGQDGLCPEAEGQAIREMVSLRLEICEQMVESLGGRLALESLPDQGIAYSFQLSFSSPGP